MAVEVETQGQLQEFLGILRRRKWQVILPAAIVISLGIFVAVVIPKKYLAKTQIELRPVGVSISPKEPANAPFQIKAPTRIKQVVNDLQNREYLALSSDERNEWLNDIAKNIKVDTAQSSTSGTSFVTIQFADVQRQWAADFLNALSKKWIDDVVDRDRRKGDDELEKLRESRAALQRQYAKEELALTELLRSHNLSATQPIPGSDAARGEDPVFERLQRNQTDADRLQREIDDHQVRLDAMKKRLEAMPHRVDLEEKLTAGVSNDAELRQIESDILAAQAELVGIKPLHPRFQQARDKIRGLEARKDQLSRVVQKGELLKSSRANPEILPLQSKIDELETDLAVAKSTRERLLREIDADSQRVSELQDVYREVRTRKESIARLDQLLGAAEARYANKFAEVDQLKSPLANPFEITQAVDVPTKPTEPNPWLIVSFALVAGLGLGLGLAVLAEYSRNCFRTVSDIGRVMVVPVLGSVGAIVTRREARLQTLRRAIVGTSGTLLVAVVLFVTWAWAKDAQLLSQDVRDAIEKLRTALK